MLTLVNGGAHIGFDMNLLYKLLILLFSIITFITIYFEFFNKKYRYINYECEFLKDVNMKSLNRLTLIKFIYTIIKVISGSTSLVLSCILFESNNYLVLTIFVSYFICIFISFFINTATEDRKF